MNALKTAVLSALTVLTLGITTAGQAAQLSGSFSNAPGTYNLTSNSADWVHFGFVPIELDRKRGVTPQITDYTPLNGADPGSTTRMNTSYSWSDGLAPAETIGSTVTGKRVFQLTKGFRFSVPARTSLRTLRVYVGAWSAEARFTARLSDGSAPAYTTVVDSTNGYTGRVITLNFRGASNNATLVVDYLVTRKNPRSSFITLESAALNAAGGQGSALLTGTNTSSPASINLTAVGPTDWVHWGRISDQPTDRKAAVVQKISGHDTIGDDVSPSVGVAGSGASWTDGSPNLVVRGSRTGIRVFDINKGMKVSVAASTQPQTVKAYVGLAGAATAQFRASLSDSSAAAYTRNVSNAGGGRRTFEFTVTFAAAAANRELTLAWMRTNPRSRVGSVSLESVKLLGQPEPDTGNPGGGNPTPPPPPPPGTGTAALGDLVWVDTNGDGLQSTGETGLSGVAVSLSGCGSNATLASTTTDGNGKYEIGGLAAGRYELKIAIPPGYKATRRRVGSKRYRDSDALANGSLGCVRAAANKTIRAWDAGLEPTESGGGNPNPGPGNGSGGSSQVSIGNGTTRLGNRVWNDRNGDGLQSAGEPGVTGVRVNLHACGSSTSLGEAATDENGRYLFTGISGGRYYLNFIAPVGRTFTAQAVGSRRGADSDPDSTGSTPCFRVGNDQTRLNFDAGLR